MIFITGKPARSAAMQVLFLLSGPKIGFFAPAGATRCPDKCEIGTGSQISRYRGKNVGIQPPKLSKF